MVVNVCRLALGSMVIKMFVFIRDFEHEIRKDQLLSWVVVVVVVVVAACFCSCCCL